MEEEQKQAGTIEAGDGIPAEADQGKTNLPSAFQSRMDAVFGNLGGSAEGSSWSLNPSPVFKAGKDIPAAEIDDVDDDATMEVAKSRLNPLMSGDVWATDDEDEDNKSPVCDPSVSLQFRQAFEDEEEADEFDEVAVASYTGEDASKDMKRLRHLEVADDNVFERMCSAGRQLNAISAGNISPMDVEEPQPAAANKPHNRKRPQDKRRVRFKLGDGDEAEESPGAVGGSPTAAQHVEAEKNRESNSRGEENGSVRGDDVNGRATSHKTAGTSQAGDAARQKLAQWNRHWQPQQGAQTVRGRGRYRGRRGVPDHVSNPHKWTCYTLDEPIYVGQGPTRNSESEQQLAVSSSDMATAYISAEPEGLEPRFDPNQTTQIVFKRKGTPSTQQEGGPGEGGAKQPARSGHARMLAGLHEGDEESDDNAMHAVELPASTTVGFNRPTVSGRKRSLRAKSTSEDDNMDDA